MMINRQKMFVSCALLLSGIVAGERGIFVPPMSTQGLNQIKAKTWGQAAIDNVDNDSQLVRAFFEGPAGGTEVGAVLRDGREFDLLDRRWKTQCQMHWGQQGKAASWYCMVFPKDGYKQGQAGSGQHAALYQAPEGGHLSFYYATMLTGGDTGVHSKVVTDWSQNFSHQWKADFGLPNLNWWGLEGSGERAASWCTTSYLTSNDDPTVQQIRSDHCAVFQYLLAEAQQRIGAGHVANLPAAITHAAYSSHPAWVAANADLRKVAGVQNETLAEYQSRLGLRSKASQNETAATSADVNLNDKLAATSPDELRAAAAKHEDELRAAETATAALGTNETVPLLACTQSDVQVGVDHLGKACYWHFQPMGACANTKLRNHTAFAGQWMYCCDNNAVNGLCFNSEDPKQQFGGVLKKTIVNGRPHLYLPRII